MFLPFWPRQLPTSQLGALYIWVPNVLRATSACMFSTSELPRLLRHCGALAFWVRNRLRATRACNFLFLISPDGSTPATLASLLADPPEPVSRLFFSAHLRLLSSDSSLIFFSSLIFSDSSHLCFFICLIVGSLISKFRRFLCVWLYMLWNMFMSWSWWSCWCIIYDLLYIYIYIYLFIYIIHTFSRGHAYTRVYVIVHFSVLDHFQQVGTAKTTPCVFRVSHAPGQLMSSGCRICKLLISTPTPMPWDPRTWPPD